jgi:hypothetical protein
MVRCIDSSVFTVPPSTEIALVTGGALFSVIRLDKSRQTEELYISQGVLVCCEIMNVNVFADHLLCP